MKFHNLKDAWIDWRDGTLTLKECLLLLSFIRGRR